MRQPTRFVPRQVPADALLDWRRLLAQQHGVASASQLAAFGVTPDAIEANVDAGRWSHVLPRIYAMQTGQLPRPAMITAALLYAGPQALLSHHTAAEEWRMIERRDGPVHVTVPYGCSAVSQPPWLVVHRSRAFRHIAVPAALPLVGRADTAVDLAVAEPSARLAMRRLVALVTTNRLPVEELRWRIEERRPRRYRTAINNAVRLMASGVSSPLEELFAVDVEQAHALPASVRQVPFTVDGRRLWEDATYDHVGVPLTVRLDGQRYHTRSDVAFRDRRRDNAAELAGRHRLVYGWKDLAADPCGAAGEVAAVLRRSGWAGPVRPCTRCG